MIRIGIGERSPIGVDFDGRFVKAAQLQRAGREWRLAAAVRLPRMVPGPVFDPHEVQAFCDALARQGFKGNHIVAAVPEEKLVAGILELPPRSSGAPLETIARTELASMNGYEPAAAETVSWDLPASPRRRDTTQAMAMACRHADAEAILETFEAAGLEPRALDSRLHALVRACRPVMPEAGITAILDLEWDWAMCVLLCQSTAIYRWLAPEAAVGQLAQTLSNGVNLEADLVDSLLADVGLVPPDHGEAPFYDAAAALIRKHLDALADGMRSPLAYSMQQYPGPGIESVLLTGCGAAIPGAGTHLAKRLEVNVRTVGPADVVPCPPSLGAKASDPGLVVAVGLAQFSE